MQPTFLPPERIRHHEAAGEWPCPSLSVALTARVAATPDATYMVEGVREGGARVSFRDLEARAARIAVALRSLGITAGDVVSWQLPNWIESAALAVALDRLGVVSNPILPIYREQEVGFACRQARSRALVVPGELRGVDHRDIAATVQATAPDLEHVLTVRASPGAGQRAIADLEDDPADPLPPSPLGPHDVSAIFYTSGTTSDPKGVLHTASTLGGYVHSNHQLYAPAPGDMGLLQFPLTHIGGLTSYVLSLVVGGGGAVYMDGYDPALAIDLIERHQVTNAGGPPAILQGIFAAPTFSPEKMRSVRTAGSGAADVSPDLMREAAEKLGAIVYRSYGLTECPMFTSAALDDPEAKRYGTDGRPVPGARARLVDDEGRPVGANVEGEIEAFGPQLCVGYLDASLNEAFTADGWFRTGDLGVVDDEGFLRITGRRKDIIIRKGENLSAKGIEDELAEHPQVAEVAVVGVPDPASGERVCACVVLRPDAGALDLAEIRRFMQDRGVMMQKIPEQLELLSALPRNATGKVRKDQLRARLRGEG